MPADAVLSGLLLLLSFFMSHCRVHVPGTAWIEPVILWIVISMPAGSGKTPLFVIFSIKSEQNLRSQLLIRHGSWMKQVLKKMGELMAQSDGKMLGMYDELTMFLAQINVHRGK